MDPSPTPPDPNDPNVAAKPGGRLWAYLLGPRNVERLANADKPSVISLVAANLLPLIGVVALGWDVQTILPLYWLETIVIGIFAGLRMAFADSKVFGAGKWFLIPFFCFHFGMFCTVHGALIIGLFELDLLNSINSHSEWMGPLVLLQIPLGVIAAMLGLLGWWGGLSIGGLFVSHGISFMRNYIGRGEYRQANPVIEMAKPYGRIVLLHVCLILGGFLTFFLGSPWFLVLLFILAKLVIDLRVHLWSHSTNLLELVNTAVENRE